MSTRRWSKFWWQDWQRDPALRMCSLSARGLWMEMLAIMHDAEPCGHFLVNGKIPSDRQIAAVVGSTEREVRKLIDELENSGVFSRTSDGVVYSRRMVRDKAISDKAVADGKKGGNPTITRTPKGKVNSKNDETSKGGLTPPVNSSPRGGVNLQEAEADIPSLRSGRLAPPLPDQPVDARTRLFAEGKATLSHMTGKSASQCGALLGRWLKTCGDQCDLLLAVIHDAADQRPAEAVPWIERAIQSRVSAGPASLTRTERVAAAWANVPDFPGV